jgi:hypothetical protein
VEENRLGGCGPATIGSLTDLTDGPAFVQVDAHRWSFTTGYGRSSALRRCLLFGALMVLVGRAVLFRVVDDGRARCFHVRRNAETASLPCSTAVGMQNRIRRSFEEWESPHYSAMPVEQPVVSCSSPSLVGVLCIVNGTILRNSTTFVGYR